jgi:hypothetical protein
MWRSVSGSPSSEDALSEELWSNVQERAAFLGSVTEAPCGEAANCRATLFPPPALCERRHRRLPRRLVAVGHQRREAMERLAQGAAQAELARSYGVSQSTISRLAAPGPFEARAVAGP